MFNSDDDDYTIDRKEAVDIFQKILDSRKRHILRIAGDSKMGKTYLLSLLRRYAEEKSILCAWIDLHFEYEWNRAIESIIGQIGVSLFEKYGSTVSGVKTNQN